MFDFRRVALISGAWGSLVGLVGVRVKLCQAWSERVEPS
jgi:hypothetical protein